MTKPISTRHAFRESLLFTVILVLVLGSLALAITDSNYRQAFADLAKIGISGFIGWMAPKSYTS